MKRVAMLCLLLSAGCATTGPASFEDLDAVLTARLMNHSSRDAVALLGRPHRQVDKGHFVEWQWEASALTTSRTDTDMLTVGTIGRDAKVPYAETTTITTRTPVALNCQLRIGVQNGIIGGYGYTGEWGACRPFYERLTQ